MDGVIFDSERACLVCWSELAKKYGLSDVEEVFTKCIGTNKNQTAEIVNNAYSAEFGPDIADKLLVHCLLPGTPVQILLHRVIGIFKL